MPMGMPLGMPMGNGVCQWDFEYANAKTHRFSVPQRLLEAPDCPSSSWHPLVFPGACSRQLLVSPGLPRILAGPCLLLSTLDGEDVHLTRSYATVPSS